MKEKEEVIEWAITDIENWLGVKYSEMKRAHIGITLSLLYDTTQQAERERCLKIARVWADTDPTNMRGEVFAAKEILSAIQKGQEK